VNRLTELFRRAEYILQTEGVIPLLRLGFTFVIGHFFQYGISYLTHNDLSFVGNEADFLPKLPDFTVNPTFKIIATNKEAYELEAEGIKFRSSTLNTRERLDNEAVAFCLLVGQELASVIWVGMTQRAKDILKEPPYQVEFSHGQVCMADQWTNLKYRGMGLGPYTARMTLQFLKKSGYSGIRGSVPVGNIASQRAASKQRIGLYAKARYIRIFWWKFWKEKPIEQPRFYPE